MGHSNSIAKQPSNASSDSSTQPRYIHSPLSEPREIRLLVINSGSSEEPLELEIENISLTSPEKYDALSYVWGDPQPRTLVKCHNAYVEVGPSLLSALKHLRRPDQERRLWVDAICINQSDVPEKNSQLPLMGEIYSKAEQTVIWLGEETEASSECFQAIDEVWKLVVPGGGIGTGWKVRMKLDKLYQDEQVLQIYSLKWRSIVRLLVNPWFSRKWVLQEAVKSKNPIFQLGYKTAPLQTITNCLAGICGSLTFATALDSFLPDPTERTSLAANNIIFDTINQLRTGGWGVIGQLLITARYLQCTDPRDHLFSLLGMASNIDDSPLIQPDYGISVTEMCRRYAQWQLSKDPSLEFLCLAGLSSGDAAQPSWLPQLSDLDNTKSRQRPQSYLGMLFEAGKPAVVDAQILGTSRLRLKGTRVADIEAVGNSKTFDAIEFMNQIGEKEARGESNLDVRVQRIRNIAQWADEAVGIAAWPNETLSPARFSELARTLIGKMNSKGLSGEISRLEDTLRRYFKAMEDCKNIKLDSLESLSEWRARAAPDFIPFEKLLYEVAGSSLLRLSDMRLALAFLPVLQGDQVVIFDGARTPHVIRENGKGEYQLVGECYVYGLMHGELFEMEKLESRMFTLV